MRTFLTSCLLTLTALLFTPSAEATPLVRNSTTETTNVERTVATTPYAVDAVNMKQQQKAAKKAAKHQKRIERMKKRLAKWQSRAVDDDANRRRTMMTIHVLHHPTANLEDVCD